jgi:L-alanine-DL-glutamate epimerase-like enolase superfamily enzyme
MRTKRITLKKYDRPFRFKFHNTQTLRKSAESVIVRLDFKKGISGYGERMPMAYVTGEDCSTVFEVIPNSFVRKRASYSISVPFLPLREIEELFF